MADLPNTMKAMVLTGHGGLDKLVWHENWPVAVPFGQNRWHGPGG